METTKKRMESLLRCMAERKLGELTALFAERVDWYIPGNKENVPWVGRRQSRADIGDFYRQLWEHTEALSATIDALLVEGQQAVAVGEFTTRMLVSGKSVRSFFCIHAQWEQGLIVRYRLFEDTHAVSESMTLAGPGSERRSSVGVDR